MTFSLYENQEGGAPLWVEVQNVLLDDQGRYSVALGAASGGLPTDLFTTTIPHWLGVKVQVDGEVEQPRILLYSVPYALKAADAETINGKPASAFVLAKKSAADSSDASDGPVKAQDSGSPNRVLKWTGTGATQGDSSIQDNGSLVNLTIDASGNVGVGTTTPAQKLDVSGTVRASNLDINGSLQAFGGAVPAGAYGVQFVGAPGADRDIFLAGAVGLSMLQCSNAAVEIAI